jgi:hypothetical protein
MVPVLGPMNCQAISFAVFDLVGLEVLADGFIRYDEPNHSTPYFVLYPLPEDPVLFRVLFRPPARESILP